MKTKTMTKKRSIHALKSEWLQEFRDKRCNTDDEYFFCKIGNRIARVYWPKFYEYQARFSINSVVAGDSPETFKLADYSEWDPI